MSDGPLQLDELPRRGAVIHGSPVSRVVLILKDGRRSSFDLPNIGELTAQQEKILETLSESSSPMNRKNIALKINKGNVTGRFGQSIAFLLSAGKIFERDGELTDDAKKFASTP